MAARFLFIIILLRCFFHASVLFAQTASISGSVTDADNNEELIGATIAVQTTSFGTVTDLDGKFLIDHVPVGTYTLKVSYVGYESKELSGVLVSASVVNVLHITLGVAKTNTLNEVVVTAEAGKETQSSMLMIQKNSGAISNFISADMIRKSPDKNTIEVLKRVSGVTIQDNKFVVVRGMNDRYNDAMLNGALLPSSEPDRKTFSFDIFPAAVVDNITIVKSATPDLAGDFSGGLIQIHTKDIPDKNFISVKAGKSYNSISTFKSYSTYQGGKTDWLGIDDGTRALPPGFFTHEEFKTISDEEIIRDAQSLQNNWAIQQKNSSPLNPTLELAGGFKLGKKSYPSFGGILGITYNSTRKQTPVERFDYSGSDNALSDTIYKYNDTSFTHTTLSSALADFSFKINSNNKISLNNIFSINSTDQTVLRNGYSFSQGAFVSSNSFYFSSNRILNSQLTGDHYIPGIKLRIKWTGYYTSLNRDEPNYRTNLYWKYSVDEPYFCVVSSSGSTNTGAGLQYFGTIKDHAYGANVDLSEPFQLFHQPQTFKFGGTYYHDLRDRDVRVLSNIIANSGSFNFNYYFASQDTIFAPSHFDLATGFTLSEDPMESNHYDGSIQNAAGYVMLDNKFADKIRFVWGLRLESYHPIVNTFDENNLPYTADTTYNDFLPSANLIVSVLKDANLRLTFNQAVARPAYREIAAARFYDFLQNITFYGNPKLVETHINNYEIRWEHYFKGVQYYSISGFYKTFKDPIEQNLAFAGSDSRSITWKNAEKANNAGVELEGRKNFDFIGKGWENLSAYANFTFIKSKVFVNDTVNRISYTRPLEGQSPIVVNATLQYTEPKTNLGVSLLLNAIGHRLYLVGIPGSLGDQPIWQKVHPTLDLKLSKSFLQNGLIELTWGDIMHGNDIFYQDLEGNELFNSESSPVYNTTDKMIANQHFGYTLSLAMRYTF